MVQQGEPQHASSTWDNQGGHSHANEPKRARFIHHDSPRLEITWVQSLTHAVSIIDDDNEN